MASRDTPVGTCDLLPRLTPIRGLRFVRDPYDLLEPEERRALHEKLAAMASARRRTDPGRIVLAALKEAKP